MNRKISDCGGMPTEVAKVFSSVKEGIGLDDGWGKGIAECIIGFVIKYWGWLDVKQTRWLDWNGFLYSWFRSPKCYVEEIQQDATVCRYLLLLNYSTCFWRPSPPSSGVHKTVVATSGADHTIWEVCFTDSMICTRGCNYSVMYSWWARWTSETCRVI